METSVLTPLEIFVNLMILTTITTTAVYLLINLLGFVLCTVAARKFKSYQIQQKYFNHPYDNQLAILIYAHNDEKNIVTLLEKLNKQNYSKVNYQVHIVLDNSTDNSSNMLEFVGGAKIWRVGENEPLGKDAALSWVLERLISFQNVNAYVFLDVNKKIDENFLANINSALFSGDVLVGAVELINEDDTFVETMKTAFNRFKNRVILSGRRFLFGGLATCIDSDITIIKQEVLEKVKCIDFKDVDSELKYTTLLVRNRIIPKFAPNVVVYANAKEYENKKHSLKRRLSLFFHCLSLMFTTNLKFIEHVFYLLRSNILLLLAIFSMIMYYGLAFEPNNIITFAFVSAISASSLALLAWIIGLSYTKMNKKEILALIVYPLYTLAKPLAKLGIIKKFVQKLLSVKNTVQIVEKFAVDVEVCGGEKNFRCKLEIIKEENFTKAIFLFKNKKYTSAPHLRTYEAVGEVIDKLDAHGFRLKVCQTCGYFCPKMETETDELKGFCYCERCFDSIDTAQQSKNTCKEAFFWNLCEKYIPKEINNVIDISTYM